MSDKEIPESIEGETTSPSLVSGPDEPTTPQTTYNKVSAKRELGSAFDTPRQHQTDITSTVSPLTPIMNSPRFRRYFTEEKKRRSAYTLLLRLYDTDTAISDILADAAKIIPTIVSEESPTSPTPGSNVSDALSRRINPEDEQDAAQFLDILLDERQRRGKSEKKSDNSRRIKRRKGNKGDIIQESFSDEEQDEPVSLSIFADAVVKLIVDIDNDQQVVKGDNCRADEQLEAGTMDDRSNTPFTRSI